MTPSQLQQFLRTYSTHWISWWVVLYWFVIHIQLPSLSEPGLATFVWMSLVANMALGTGIGVMLKIQFADPRARLLPSFRVAHLVATGVMVCTVLVIETVLMPASAFGTTGLGLLSLTFVAMVAGAWLAYSGVWLLVAPVVLAPILVPQLLEELTQALIGSPIVSLGATAVGIAAMVALSVRLWILSEEKAEYSQQIYGAWDFTSQAGNRNWRRLEAAAICRSAFWTWIRDLQFRLVVRPGASMGKLRRKLYRQLAGGFSSLSMLPSVFGIMLFLFWYQSGSGRPMEPGEFFPLAFFALQLVLSIVIGMWMQRWRYLASESLWQLERRDFVRDLARSLACDMAPGAAAHCGAIVVSVIFFFPQDPLAELVVPWLALTAVQYVLAWCLMFRLVASRNVWVLIPGAVGVSVLSAALVTAALYAPPGSWSPVSLAVAVIATAVAVVLLYRPAFRRWCHVDLG